MQTIEDIVRENPIDCGACTKCCRHFPSIFILPELGDDLSLYEGDIERDPTYGKIRLKYQPNGDCIYLDRKTGCTAYDKRPRICHAYDCREGYIKNMSHSRTERRALMKAGTIDEAVHKEGQKRLKALLASQGTPGDLMPSGD